MFTHFSDSKHFEVPFKENNRKKYNESFRHEYNTKIKNKKKNFYKTSVAQKIENLTGSKFS